jgi:hypothetical protein
VIERLTGVRYHPAWVWACCAIGWVGRRCPGSRRTSVAADDHQAASTS